MPRTFFFFVKTKEELILASSLHRTSQHRDCSSLKINNAELDLPIHSFSSKLLVRTQAEGNVKQFLRCEAVIKQRLSLRLIPLPMRIHYKLISVFQALSSPLKQFSSLNCLHFTLPSSV